MGQISRRKIIIVIILFIISGLSVNWQPEAAVAKKQISLTRALADIDGWHSSGLIPIEKNVTDALDLDEYANQYYKNGRDQVFLYIGYYLTEKKVGAAHSPLVCFPGQGWLLSDAEQKSFKVGDKTINLNRIVASMGNRKELLIYWFQAFDKTSPGTFAQKLNTLWSKFVNGRGDNAFVRVTIPMNEMTADEAYAIGHRFIEDFYPRFLTYVKLNQS